LTVAKALGYALEIFFANSDKTIKLDNENLGASLRSIREKAGISQPALAALMGTQGESLSRTEATYSLESGKLDRLAYYAQFLHYRVIMQFTR